MDVITSWPSTWRRWVVPVTQPRLWTANQQLCEMFGATRELLIGQSFQVLYPSADEYERLGARMAPS